MNLLRVTVLKFTVLAAGMLALAGCASVDEFRNNTIKGWDTAEDSLDEALIDVDTRPRQAEDYLENPCPNIKLVNDLGIFYDFSDFRSPNESNLITRVKVSRLPSSCSYTDKSVTADIKLVFEAFLGPAARRGPHDTFFTYPFFVAITSPSNQLMAREVFAAPMTFAPGQDRQVHYENLRQVIPIPKEYYGRDYSIIIGFQLNKQQLAYNRELEKVREKRAKEQAKAEKAAAKNAPPIVPLQETVIIQQSPPPAPAPVIAPPVPAGPTPLTPPPGH